MNDLIAQFEMEQANISTDVSDTINNINKSLTPFQNKQAHVEIMKSITEEL